MKDFNEYLRKNKNKILKRAYLDFIQEQEFFRVQGRFFRRVFDGSNDLLNDSMRYWETVKKHCDKDIPNIVFHFLEMNFGREMAIKDKFVVFKVNLVLKVIKGNLEVEQYRELERLLIEDLDEETKGGFGVFSSINNNCIKEFLQFIKPMYEAKILEQQLNKKKNTTKKNILKI